MNIYFMKHSLHGFQSVSGAGGSLCYLYNRYIAVLQKVRLHCITCYSTIEPESNVHKLLLLFTSSRLLWAVSPFVASWNCAFFKFYNKYLLCSGSRKSCQYRKRNSVAHFKKSVIRIKLILIFKWRGMF